MSRLASDFFAQSPALLLPVLALVLFVVVFTVMTVRAMKMNKKTVTRLASLPLQHQEDADG